MTYIYNYFCLSKIMFNSTKFVCFTANVTFFVYLNKKIRNTQIFLWNTTHVWCKRQIRCWLLSCETCSALNKNKSNIAVCKWSLITGVFTIYLIEFNNKNSMYFHTSSAILCVYCVWFSAHFKIIVYKASSIDRITGKSAWHQGVVVHRVELR